MEATSNSYFFFQSVFNCLFNTLQHEIKIFTENMFNLCFEVNS